MTDAETQDNSIPLEEQPAEPALRNRAHVRERILRRFELWLDEILDGEQPPEGIAAEILEQLETDAPPDAAGEDWANCDWHALWSAMTTMAEETRLQGRAFKQLHDGLSPMQDLVGSVSDMLHRYEASLDRQEQRTAETAQQAAWDDVLETLIDMRERLLRGSQSAQAWFQQPRPAKRSRLVANLCEKVLGRQDDAQARRDEAVRSLLKGFHLCQEVLDEALTRIGVRPIDCLDRPFDPLTMKAIDIACDPDAPDGAVLEVYRQGYRWNEAIYRPAEVKVARRRNGMQQNEQSLSSDQGEKYGSQ
ncbi:MAG TPA: nucleotide exchange factor GrpE [Sedimentisphaerales bacterium]|nr:nucleotide exchange factor GrpE [Sedimentisphaerales bacterium]